MKTRQFKVSRILDVFDAETGEAYASPSSFFEHFAVDQVHRSRPGWGLGVQHKADFTALLNSVVFIARCDDEYHPLERSTLEDLVMKFWLRFEIFHEPDCEAILSHADRLDRKSTRLNSSH